MLLRTLCMRTPTTNEFKAVVSVKEADCRLWEI